MSTRKISLIVAGVFTLLAIIGVIVGLLTHDEPGFIDAAYTWDHMPLEVYCTGYVEADDEACDIAEDVVGVINHRLGRQLLLWTDHASSADIVVTMRAPVEVGEEERDIPGGHYRLTKNTQQYTHCEVQTMNVSGGAGNLEWLVLYHEIGCHCLGLAHDDYEQSICYPVQTATPARTIPAWISDSDRELLRDKYLLP